MTAFLTVSYCFATDSFLNKKYDEFFNHIQTNNKQICSCLKALGQY